MPRVLKGHYLGCRAFARGLFEKNIVVLVTLEGWIEIDQVHRFVPQMAAEDFEIVAVEERILHCSVFLILRELE
jgi:hypothetical protein